MSIRIRTVNGHMVALCAARSVLKDGDFYLDDAQHHALAEKFRRDYTLEGRFTGSFDREEADLADGEESNNPNREWWDRTYT